MFYNFTPKAPAITFQKYLGAQTASGPGYARRKSMIVVAKIFIELLISLALAVLPISAFAGQFGDTSVPESPQATNGE
jgi:hypothetical protein